MFFARTVATPGCCSALQVAAPGTKMLLQIHDELVFEVPEEDIERVAQFVQARMCAALELSVPIEANVSFGPRWFDTK